MIRLNDAATSTIFPYAFSFAVQFIPTRAGFDGRMESLSERVEQATDWCTEQFGVEAHAVEPDYPYGRWRRYGSIFMFVNPLDATAFKLCWS